MPTLYQITFYQIGSGVMRSAFLQSDQAYRALRVGDVFSTGEFPGLYIFSACLEVMSVQQHASRLSRQGKAIQPWLVITRAYEQPDPVAFPDFAGLLNKHMAGDM